MNKNYDFDWRNEKRTKKGVMMANDSNKIPFQKTYSAGNYNEHYETYGYKQNTFYKHHSNDGYRGKQSQNESSSIKSVSELFHVLLNAGKEQDNSKRSTVWKPSSENNNHNVLMQKMLDSSSISWSLFEDSEDEAISENEAQSSENDESELSSETENEEDFDEDEINENSTPLQSKVKNKDVYLKYLSSIYSTPIENMDPQLEKGWEFDQKAPDPLKSKKKKSRKHRVPKTVKEIYKISKMNKMMYKQKRKAILNKENRDEENKMNKSNIMELLKEWSDDEFTKTMPKETRRPKDAKKFTTQHLDSNPHDFIKSIGWVKEKGLFTHSKQYSRDYEGQQYDGFNNQQWQKPRASWSNKKYYPKSGYYEHQDYHR